MILRYFSPVQKKPHPLAEGFPRVSDPYGLGETPRMAIEIGIRHKLELTAEEAQLLVARLGRSLAAIAAWELAVGSPRGATKAPADKSQALPGLSDSPERSRT